MPNRQSTPLMLALSLLFREERLGNPFPFPSEKAVT